MLGRPSPDSDMPSAGGGKLIPGCDPTPGGNTHGLCVVMVSLRAKENV